MCSLLSFFFCKSISFFFGATLSYSICLFSYQSISLILRETLCFSPCQSSSFLCSYSLRLHFCYSFFFLPCHLLVSTFANRSASSLARRSTFSLANLSVSAVVKHLPLLGQLTTHSLFLIFLFLPLLLAEPPPWVIFCLFLG